MLGRGLSNVKLLCLNAKICFIRNKTTFQNNRKEISLFHDFDRVDSNPFGNCFASSKWATFVIEMYN